MDFTQYDFIEQKYNGILEIYPRKAMNSYVYESVLYDISKEYNIVKVFDGWLRAFKKQ